MNIFVLVDMVAEINHLSKKIYEKIAAGLRTEWRMTSLTNIGLNSEVLFIKFVKRTASNAKMDK